MSPVASCPTTSLKTSFYLAHALFAPIVRQVPSAAKTTCRRTACVKQLLACANELARRHDLRRLQGVVLSSPQSSGDYFKTHFQGYEVEAFVCMYLDSQMRVIAVEELFRGTLTQTSVYPREVVRRALAVNAGVVIAAHNHPSGSSEPSRADEYLTKTLKTALALMDISLLDHIVVGADQVVSLASRGLV
jgi:DNA repair protein RadC